jgi:hypothetical protein
VIGGMCLALIETRWLYGHRIVGFLLHHADAIKDLSGDRNPVTAALSECHSAYQLCTG